MTNADLTICAPFLLCINILTNVGNAVDITRLNTHWCNVGVSPDALKLGIRNHFLDYEQLNSLSSTVLNGLNVQFFCSI